MTELKRSPDLVVVEDLTLLPAVIGNYPTVKVLLDLRDDRTVQFSHIPFWRRLVGSSFERLLAWSGPRCHSVMTVSEGLRHRFEAMMARSVEVVRSIPDDVPSQGMLARQTTAPIRMVHHGRVGLSRKLHRLIAVAKELGPEFTLDLFLVGSRVQKAFLQLMCLRTSNVRMRAPVPFRDIHFMLQDYDVGIMLFEPINENLLSVLPNKFFEFINAGLGVVSGPSPEIARIVRDFSCGVIAETFDVGSMVTALSGLTPEAAHLYREKSLAAASILSWENERVKLQRLLPSH